MPVLSAQIERLTAEQARMATIQATHDEKDERRFEEQRKEREEGDRRLYEKFEAALAATGTSFGRLVGEAEQRTLIAIAQMGTKVDTAVTGLVAETSRLDKSRQEADVARAFAEGRSAARQPSPAQRAMLEGATGAIVSATIGLLVAVLVAAASWWAHDQLQTSRASVTTTVETPQHQRTR